MYEHAERYERYLQNVIGMSKLEACLGFARNCLDVDVVVVGVTSENEWIQVLDAWDKVKGKEMTWALDWGWSQDEDIDPRTWGRLQR